MALALCAPRPAEPRTGPHFEQGVQQLKQLEYDEALKSFERAGAWPGNTARDRASILVHVGIAQSSLGDHAAAEKSFKEALALDRGVPLPDFTSPKIQALFERVQEETTPQPTVKPEPAPEAGPPPMLPKPPPPAEEPTRSRWPAWVALGAGVAAGGAGLAMALLYRSEKDKAEDLSTRYPEARDHADRANAYRIAAPVLFAAAGAALTTSAVLFYLGRKKERASAAILPVPSGVVLQASWEVGR